MNASASRWAVAALAAACAAPRGHGQCSNACGAGSLPEAENCVVVAADRANDGCNIGGVFQDVAALPVTVCGTASTNVDGANSRDTDWYRLTPAALAAADLDGNGVVLITGDLEGEPQMVTFLIDLGEGGTPCPGTIVGAVGCSAPGCAGGADSGFTVVIDDHPHGVVVFAATGNCNGSGIFTGFPCAGGQNDYTLTITGSDPPTACQPGAGPCNLPHANPGCDDPDVGCCVDVCEGDPFCCNVEWDGNCAAAAIAAGCAPEPGGPVDIATGPSSAADNYLRVSPDAYGSWTDTTFGGLGDTYNPVGPLPAQPVSFTNGFMLFRAGAAQRELLSTSIDWQDTVGPDPSLGRVVTSLPVAFDTDGDAVNDTMTSSFQVTGAGFDLGFDHEASVGQDETSATVTQTYVITNNGGATISVELLHLADYDLVWVGDFATDSVGTERAPASNSVFQQEEGAPETRVTVSSGGADGYAGAKNGVQPENGPPAYGFGTDLQEWGAFGLPATWVNHIAGVGYSTIGESGATPPGCTAPCDAHVDLRIPVVISGFDTAVVAVTQTFGVPEEASCPWDCGDFDDVVDIDDFLALLIQFGLPGSCDTNQSGAVDVNDLFALLENWGPCGAGGPGGGEVFVGSGTSPFVDGFLAVGPDPFGSWSHLDFGGTGDQYNPASFNLASAAFSSGMFLFVGNDRRELLSANDQWQVGLGFESDASLQRAVTMPSQANDSDNDGVHDELSSQVTVTGAGVDLTIDLLQRMESEGGAAAALTQQYRFVNHLPQPIDLVLVWVGDFNLIWVGNDLGDDSVGTDRADAEPCTGDCFAVPNGVVDIQDLLALLSQWDGPGSCNIDGQGVVAITDLLALLPQFGECFGPAVFMHDLFIADETLLTVSCDQADAYAGGKRGVDPDGGGSGPPYGMGTATEVWDNYGLPATWVNHIAGVGYGADGDSGSSPAGCVPPCDGAVYLRIPLHLEPGVPRGDASAVGPGSGFVIVRTRYGTAAP